MSHLQNKWIIKYIQEEYTYQDILDNISQINKNNLFKKNNNITKFYIDFNKKYKQNKYFLKKGINDNIIILNINNVKDTILRSIKEIKFNHQFNNNKTKKVKLLYPALKSDKRWNSIELPASSIYLGSALKNKNFNVDIKKLILPAKQNNNDLLKYDVIGFSIFEDLFIEIKDFLEAFSKSFSGLLIGGGPMVTLLPLQTAYNLKDINLLIRGEAEMILPKILELLSKGDLNAVLKLKGFLLNLPGMLVISNINYINRPDNFHNFDFDLSFAKDKQLEKGLEINISRGCKRTCIFCSKVQGRVFRKVEPEKFEKLLIEMSKRIVNINSNSLELRAVNINDDDILQDKVYAENIFNKIIKHNFKIWGIQTSIQSFFINSNIDESLISLINMKNLYVTKKPLIWLGTDAFLKSRGKKLAKFIPDIISLKKLLKIFEDKKIKNIHYWISSDPNSTWEEFIDEYIIIDNLLQKYKFFEILAHAPFLIPYSSTPLNKLLTNSKSNQIIFSKKLQSNNPEYDILFADKVITKYTNLNKLLSNEKIVDNKGFFDCLKNKDRFNSFLTIYNFIKKERLEFDADNNKIANNLKKCEERIENILSGF